MTRRSLTLTLPLCAALAVSCSDDHGLGPHTWESVPIPRELTRVEVAPVSSILLPGATQQVTIDAWDQFGEQMRERVPGEWASKLTYVSSAPAIVAVSSTGLVTAVAPGIATITASLTLANVSVTGSMTTWVDLDSVTSAVVIADKNGHWSPTTVRVKSGSTVSWLIPPDVQVGTIWLNVWDDNAEELKFVDGVATRTFNTTGSFYYGTGGGLEWYEEGGVIEVY